MAVATATCSPSSLQLRFSLGSRRLSKPAAILSRRRIWRQSRSLGYGIGERERRHCFEAVPIRSESNADGFAGWSGADNEEDSGSEKMKWFGGPVGAGVAGIALVAGLAFAAMSLGNRSNPRTRHMEPLTQQREESLLADDSKSEVSVGKEEGSSATIEDSSSFSEVDVQNEQNVDDDSVSGDLSPGDAKDTSPDMDDVSNVVIQEDLLGGLTSDDKSAEAETVSSSNNLLDPENGGFSFVTSELKNLDVAEVVSELKENPVNVGSTSFSASDDLPSSISLEYKDEIPVSDEPAHINVHTSRSNTILETSMSSTNENFEVADMSQVSVVEDKHVTLEVHRVREAGLPGTSIYEPANTLRNEQSSESLNEDNITTTKSPKLGTSFTSAGIPAPSVVSSALQVLPGKVLVPAIVDQVQSQALVALQVMKVIESEVQPGDLCTRREYARWLVSASSVLSRNVISKVYPAMYIEHVTELAFDDITPEDPDFASIQGLAEAGLISSKLSRRDMLSSVDEGDEPFFFSPESPLSRQDLVSWKMALEKRHLPVADGKVLYEVSGFIDADKIHPDACPALVADLSAGEQGIVALAFGYTRLFQPDKPVTKAQAAIALATGEAFESVSEELARIEAESMAENAVATHNALVAQVEKDMNASYANELAMEREKINAVEKMAEEARQELEKLRAEKEKDKLALMKERAGIDSEMELLSRLRHDVEEQLQSLMSNKVEVSFEKERISKLRKEAEDESREIERLQYELEVERKALSMARTWAEDEAKRAREQAKALEEARERWERHGIKIVVDQDLQEDSEAGATWVDATKQFSVDQTVDRAESLTDKLKAMAAQLSEKSRAVIDQIIQKIVVLISKLKERVSEAGKKTDCLRKTLVSKASDSAQNLQQSTSEFSSAVKGGVEKLTAKFVKT